MRTRNTSFKSIWTRLNDAEAAIYERQRINAQHQAAEEKRKSMDEAISDMAHIERLVCVLYETFGDRTKIAVALAGNDEGKKRSINAAFLAIELTIGLDSVAQPLSI